MIVAKRNTSGAKIFMNRWICLFILVTMWLGVGSAQEIAVPVDLQVALITKVLPFDRNQRFDPDGKVVIGIVYQSRFKASLDIFREFSDAALELSGDRTPIVTYRPIGIDIDKQNLEETLSKYKIQILYIAPLRATGMAEIIEVSRHKRILTITGVPEYVAAGLSVGIGVKAGRPQILINLKAARLEHADFSSQLLKLAKIIETEEGL